MSRTSSPAKRPSTVRDDDATIVNVDTESRAATTEGERQARQHEAGRVAKSPRKRKRAARKARPPIRCLSRSDA